MKQKRNLWIGGTFLVVLGALGVAQSSLQKAVAAQASNQVMAPRFEVDPMWPKPLPNNMYQGQTIGVWVDKQDHVWIIHRADSLDAAEAAANQNPPTGECCKMAPPILEFDQAGNLLRSWGGQDGPGYQWPSSNHGIFVETDGTVWIGGNGPEDGLVLKFTSDGKFLAQYGKKGVKADSNSTEHFFQVAKVFVDEKGNETYVADGYGNKRVAVIDRKTGAFKRIWGAYGNKPDDTNLGRYNPTAPVAQQFRNPVHCADLSVDNLVYVCDRVNDRMQVFTKEGKFVKEVFVQKDSLADGSVWDVAFSKDPQQRFLYMADGRNQKLRIFDRQSLTELTNFGEGGHYPGQWYSLHSIAVDSQGNLFTTETYQGRRVQKFVNKGLAPVTKKEQGAPWPQTTGR
jgi:6-phosphogluconolactonase (cycloisomerase 2 family)